MRIAGRTATLRHLAFLCTCASVSLFSSGAAEPWSEATLQKETELFATRAAGTIWEKVGNFQVQRVQFNGVKLCALSYENKPLVMWNSTQIHEPYRFHVEYNDGTSSWYFLDNDDLHLINCKVNRWVEYTADGDGWQTDPSHEFPTLHLEDDVIELGQGDDKPGMMRPCIYAGYRLSEFTTPDGRLFWAFTSATNRQLWLLQVRHVFGGRVCGEERITQLRSNLPVELPEREQRLVDFIFQLRKAGKWPAADTLSRELIRRAAARPQSQQDSLRKLLGYVTETKRADAAR